MIEGMEPPAPVTLEDLYQKISGFPESLQVDNLPMLSKASVLAQIAGAWALQRLQTTASEQLQAQKASAQALERIADILSDRQGV